jgi:hypothetical protein
MASPLVDTKIFLPGSAQCVDPFVERTPERGQRSEADLGLGTSRLRQDHVCGRLVERPAHTTSVAWLSLDEADRGPGSFWTYVVTALQAMSLGVGDMVLPLLQSAQPRR